MKEVLLPPIQEISGVIKLPGSKSLSNRILCSPPSPSQSFSPAVADDKIHPGCSHHLGKGIPQGTGGAQEKVGYSDQKLPDGISLYSIASDSYVKPSILGPLIKHYAGICLIPDSAAALSAETVFNFIFAASKISELISVLDQRKDESFERTFKGVARHFHEVFSELVQGGHGCLVMMKKRKRNDNFN